MANPFPGWTFSRYDMGVDLCGAGKPYFAPASCRRIGPPIGGWDPSLYLFEFDPPLSGTYENCQYWYVAEGITPPNLPRYKTGQKMGVGTGCNETGWGALAADSGGHMTLAATHGYSGGNLPPGTGTGTDDVFGVSFARYFGITGCPGVSGSGHVTPGGRTGGGNMRSDPFTAGKDIFANYLALRDMQRNQGITQFQQDYSDNVEKAGVGYSVGKGLTNIGQVITKALGGK